MSGCTAPRNGHRTPSGAAACPVHGGRSAYTRSYEGGYAPRLRPTLGPIGGSSRAGGSKTSKPRWAAASSQALYTPREIIALSPLRQRIEERGASATRKDLFLCHAWDDRKGMAKDLYEALTASGVSVWFSEQHLAAGTPMMRAIDKGLAASRAGLVLVTPAMLKRLPAAGVADKELSALLEGEVVLPIVHETTYKELREVSPLLASRSGYDTAEDSLQEIVEKIRDLISLGDA